MDEEATWDFNTVRARASIDASDSTDSLPVVLTDETPHPTIRPPTSKVPPTLRMLFEGSEDPSPGEPFKLPGFDTPIPVLSSSLLPPPSAGPSASRARGRSRSAVSSQEPDDDVLTAKQPTFQFPPRSATPRTARKMTISDASHSDDDNLSVMDRHPPLGPGIPSSRSPTRPSSRSPSPLSSPVIDPQQPESPYQEIEIPNLGEASTVQSDTPPPIVFSASSPVQSTSQPNRPPINRQRSKSNAMDSPPSTRASQDWSRPSPSTFQFPPPGFGYPSTPPPLSAPLTRTHNRVSPTHASASTISTVSRSSHQFTHSLDASTIQRRYQSPGSLPTPPPVLRSRSAAPFGDGNAYGVVSSSNGPEAVVLQSIPRKPSMTRLASLPVMETLHTPTRSFAFGRTERSGSVDTGPPMPGLKDVLKVNYFNSCCVRETQSCG